MKWPEFLKPYSGGNDALFDSAFNQRWAGEEWRPSDEDKKAAAKLHVQMISRITTQRLGYLDGVEKTALKSVYDLFEHTRKICTDHCEARHFAVLAWHVLNTHIRPFTAKWHLRSERGMLSALDTTDEFRSELEVLQRVLRRYETLLAHLRDGDPPPAWADDAGNERETAVHAEMEREVLWGIPPIQGGVDAVTAKSINDKERDAIHAHRAHYGPTESKTHAVALALSGGGIRSATLSLGVLVALARRGLLPQFDYLSTVSGGGYLGSFLTAYLNSSADLPAPLPLGLRSSELPFLREAGEAEALRHIRHHSKYLAMGSFADRARMAGAQLYGMALNGIGVVFLAALLALAEHFLRANGWLSIFWANFTGLFDSFTPTWTHVAWKTPAHLFGILFVVWAVVALALIRRGRVRQKVADTGLVILGASLLALFLWDGLTVCHRGVAQGHQWRGLSKETWLAILGAIPVMASLFAGLAGKVFDRVKIVLAALSALAAPLFFFGVYLALYWWADHSSAAFNIGGHPVTWLALLTAALAVVYVWFININFTSPHRHYRNKLAEAYLIQPAKTPQPDQPFEKAVDLKLSRATSPAAPYHLINAALNVPASQNPGMQGRLTDFFLFSRSFCGSPLTGYRPTTEWEAEDAHLDLGTAMAISGAAAAPQMGLGTKRRLSFWLALLNVRLGYWLRNPAQKPWKLRVGWMNKIPAWCFGGTPGLSFLLKEMRGSMDEHSPWIYLSDGGHLENLGVYELLRRRCKYIVAIDGEQDGRMTFAALTTLQRLAAIDLGVKIDISLDDLRLNEQGLSRSHFRFCRIEYSNKQYGYLLYVKLSLTGNEGEFLRRYRLDEPAFPHHSTADQFFSEAQFEAYRSLGEHIGDKLFLRALVGERLSGSTEIKIEDLFRELGTRLLEPLT